MAMYTTNNNAIKEGEDYMLSENNLVVMNQLVDLMLNGLSISDALKTVYTQRRLTIPCDEMLFAVEITKLKMSKRATNALLNAKIHTLNDLVEYCETNKITNIRSCGANTTIEIMEAILNYYWKKTDTQHRLALLSEIVVANEKNLK